MFTKGGQKNLVIWLFVIIAVFLVLGVGSQKSQTSAESVSYSQIIGIINDSDTKNQTAQIIIQGNKWKLTVNDKVYTTVAPLTDDFLKSISKKKNLEITFIEPKPPSPWVGALIGWLPFLVIFYFVYRFFKNMPAKGGGNGMAEFGKSNATIVMPDSDSAKFEDVAGCDEAKEELEDLVEFLRDPQRFTSMGSKLPKGVLLHGPPGTGKTLLAKAMAGEANVPFILAAGSDFVEMFVGVGASRVRDLFDEAHRLAPCVVFIDEIDAIGKKRGSVASGGSDEREQTLNQMLVEMDGFGENSGIIILAATNRVDTLDRALTRPGRFDRKVSVGLPDVIGREKILNIHTKNVPISLEVDLSLVAQTTPGFSGADLANLVNEASIIAALEQSVLVEPEHFEQARDKVTMGKPRKSMKMTDESRRATAIHEAGHALLAYYLEDADPLHKVTIIPHGQALGLTMQLPEDDKYSWSKKENLARIKVLLGGYIAEKMFYGIDGTSTGVSNDLMRAKQIAETMVKDYGMGSVGPVYFGSTDTYGNRGADTSDLAKEEFDDAVKEIMEQALREAERLLKEKREHIVILTNMLLEQDTVLESELEGMFGILDIYFEDDE